MYGKKIWRPEAYAATGAPMYKTQDDEDAQNINEKTYIYKLNLANGKKYIGKTIDVDRRMNEHFSGRGSQVTKKFAPKSAEVVDETWGYFSTELEQEHTEDNIDRYGYKNVRGGHYTNSKTLKATKKIVCYRCGRNTHKSPSCYAKTHVAGHYLKPK